MTFISGTLGDLTLKDSNIGRNVSGQEMNYGNFRMGIAMIEAVYVEGT